MDAHSLLNPVIFASPTPSTAMQLSLLDLGDDIIHHIVDLVPNRARRQLRCVSRRLWALVDEHLTEVDLYDRGILDSSLFLKWQRFPNIKSLNIESLRNDAARALLSTRWRELESLVIDLIFEPNGNYFFNDPTIDLSSDAFRALRHLTLSGRDVGPDTLRAIASLCPLLESLKITDSPQYDDDAFSGSTNLFVAVARAGPASLPHLRKLELHSFSLSPSVLTSFDSVPWESLEVVDISGRSMGAPKLLGGTPHWTDLIVLNVSGRITQPADLETLLGAHMTNLEVLYIQRLGVYSRNDPGIGAALARCTTQWPKLRELTVCGMLDEENELRDFMEVLLPRLESVNLGYVGEGGLAVLGASAHRWPSLKSLKLDSTGHDENFFDFLITATWQLECLIMELSSKNVDQLGALPETAPLRRSLRILRLTDNNGCISSSLFDRPWSALEELKLESFYFKAAAVTAFSSAPQRGIFPRLRKLALRDCHNSAMDIVRVDTSFEWFSGLEELDLTFSDLAGTERLGQYAAALRNLKFLSIPELDARDIQGLLRAEWPRKLERIYFEYSVEEFSGIPLDKWAEIDAPNWEAVIGQFWHENRANYVRRKY